MSAATSVVFLPWLRGADPADAQDAVIELGTNDVFASGETLVQFRTAYDYILTRVRHDAPQAKIVCLGTWRTPAQGGRFDAIIRSDCASLVGGSYVALSHFYLNAHYRGPAGIVTAFGTSDDFHPNNAGHQAIATALLAALPS
ncbi:MAG TPA: SGNH/GDSL hydrolase family protein [Ktedonobacterales bacterium]